MSVLTRPVNPRSNNGHYSPRHCGHRPARPMRCNQAVKLSSPRRHSKRVHKASHLLVVFLDVELVRLSLTKVRKRCGGKESGRKWATYMCFMSWEKRRVRVTITYALWQTCTVNRPNGWFGILKKSPPTLFLLFYSYTHWFCRSYNIPR